MILIKSSHISEEGEFARITYQLEINEEKKAIWYEVPIAFKSYLSEDRIDPLVVGILPMALGKGYNIVASDIYISRKLIENLNHTLIPELLKRNISISKKMEIIAPTDETILACEPRQVGTGMSCGVDSLFTYKGLEDSLTHLTNFNVGSHGGKKELFIQRMELSKKFTQESGKQFISVDSNISEILNLPFEPTHVYRSASAVLVLQKLFSAYYYSTGYAKSSFDFNTAPMSLDDDSAKYEHFLLPLLGTEGTSLISYGEETRGEKILAISSYPLAQRYLNVCVKTIDNCGTCEKCLRTQLSLYSQNKLQNFGQVFDLTKFNKHKHYFVSELFYQRRNDKREAIEEIRSDLLRNNLFRYNLKSYIRAACYTLKDNMYRVMQKVGIADKHKRRIN